MLLEELEQPDELEQLVLQGGLEEPVLLEELDTPEELVLLEELDLLEEPVLLEELGLLEEQDPLE